MGRFLLHSFSLKWMRMGRSGRTTRQMNYSHQSPHERHSSMQTIYEDARFSWTQIKTGSDLGPLLSRLLKTMPLTQLYTVTQQTLSLGCLSVNKEWKNWCPRWHTWPDWARYRKLDGAGVSSHFWPRRTPQTFWSHLHIVLMDAFQPLHPNNKCQLQHEHLFRINFSVLIPRSPQSTESCTLYSSPR